MSHEKPLNLEFLDENINNGRDFNFYYKKAYEVLAPKLGGYQT